MLMLQINTATFKSGMTQARESSCAWAEEEALAVPPPDTDDLCPWSLSTSARGKGSDGYSECCDADVAFSCSCRAAARQVGKRTGRKQMLRGHLGIYFSRTGRGESPEQVDDEYSFGTVWIQDRDAGKAGPARKLCAKHNLACCCRFAWRLRLTAGPL